MIMNVPNREYNFESFIQLLQKKYWEFSSQNSLKILTFATDYHSWEDLLKLFPSGSVANRKAFGEIVMIPFHYFFYNNVGEKVSRSVDCYFYLDREFGILFCFTTANIDQLTRSIFYYLLNIQGVYYIWINPPLFDKLISKILTEHENTIIPEFWLKRIEGSMYPAKIRPEFGRTIHYMGNDGKEVLSELRFNYGSLPRTIKFRIPKEKLTLTINRKGIFSVERFTDLKYVFELISEGIRINLQQRKIFESSKIDKLIFKIRNKTHEIANPIPWIIVPEKKLSYTEAKNFMESGELKSFGFSAVEKKIEEGSLYLSAIVFDEKKKVAFTIRGNEKKIVVLPHDRVHFDTFMRFYQSFVENVDPKASLVGAQGEL